MRLILMIGVFVLVLSRSAHAATWQCRWCGRKMSSPKQPAPMSNCKQNPIGKHHDWVQIH